MRRYIEAGIKFSDFCDVQTNFFEYFVKIIFTCYFPFFCFIVKWKHYRMHLLFIFVTNFKSRIFFVYELHIIILYAPSPFWHKFLHLLIQFIASMFIDADQKTVKRRHTLSFWIFRLYPVDNSSTKTIQMKSSMGFIQSYGWTEIDLILKQIWWRFIRRQVSFKWKISETRLEKHIVRYGFVTYLHYSVYSALHLI